MHKIVTYTVRSIVAAIAVTAFTPHLALAQHDIADRLAGASGSNVSGSGMVLVERPCTRLQVRLNLIGRGSDLKTAIAQLKDRQEAARVQLDALKVNADSIEIGDATPAAVTAQQSQMQKMVRQQLMRRKGGKLPEMPTMVTLTAPLKAEWSLPNSSVEEMMIAADALQKKIRDADLGGANEKQKLTAEQEELLEEMAGSMNQYGEQTAKEGTPSFIFVAKITDQHRDEAMREAFGKAKILAKRLATAADSRLGNLRSLRGQTSGMPDFSGVGYQMQQMYRAQFQGLREPGGSTDAANIGYSVTPGKVKFRFMVTATFDLKPLKEE